MGPRIAVVVLLLVGGVAHSDERVTTLTLGGMAGAFERTSQDYDYVYTHTEPLVGPRVSLAWEHAPLDMPAQRGYRLDGSIVPELIGGAFVDDVRAQMFIGAGLRAELRMSQREMGLLRVSARGAAYLAARGMIVGDDRKAYGELAVGDYLFIGRTTRIGVEGGVIFGRPDQMSDGGGRTVGGVVQAYIGWQP